MSDGIESEMAATQMVHGGVDPVQHNRQVAKNDKLTPEKMPGTLKIAVERGHAAGCAAVEFNSAGEMTDYFASRDNHLIHHIAGTGRGTTLVVWGKVLTEEELQEMLEVQAEVQKKIEERRAQRAEAEDKEYERQAKAAQDEKRFTALGKQCEANHGGLVEENRKLRSKKK